MKSRHEFHRTLTRDKWLNQVTDCYDIQLNDSSIDCFKNSKYILTQFCCLDYLTIVFCAVIKHDQDVDLETNHVKTPHYHVVLQFDKKYKLKSVLELIETMFHCNENQITIDKVGSLIGCVRYLTHIDYIDKHPYNESDIETNDRSYVKYCMEAIRTIREPKDLIAICREYKTTQKILEVIGFDNYKRYRGVIADLRREGFVY